MTFNETLPYLYYSLLLLTCGYAFHRGDRTEHIGAVIMLVGSLASTLVTAIFGTAWTGLDSGTFYIDMFVLLALTYLALGSERYWPIWAAAFHLVAISIHVATTVAPDIAPWALATGSAFWAYPMLLVLAVGSHEFVRPTPEPVTRSG